MAIHWPYIGTVFPTSQVLYICPFISWLPYSLYLSVYVCSSPERRLPVNYLSWESAASQSSWLSYSVSTCLSAHLLRGTYLSNACLTVSTRCQPVLLTFLLCVCLSVCSLCSTSARRLPVQRISWQKRRCLFLSLWCMFVCSHAQHGLVESSFCPPE